MSSAGAKLVRAAAKGDDAKVKRLLKAKVDANSSEKNENGVGGITALQEACANGHVGAVAAARDAAAAAAVDEVLHPRGDGHRLGRRPEHLLVRQAVALCLEEQRSLGAEQGAELVGGVLGARRDREELLAAARPQPRALVKPA